MLFVGNSIDTKYVRATVDYPLASSGHVDSLVQGFVGRCCGYGKQPSTSNDDYHVTCFTNVTKVMEYATWYSGKGIPTNPAYRAKGESRPSVKGDNLGMHMVAHKTSAYASKCRGVGGEWTLSDDSDKNDDTDDDEDIPALPTAKGEPDEDEVSVEIVKVKKYKGKIHSEKERVARYIGQLYSYDSDALVDWSKVFDVYTPKGDARSATPEPAEDSNEAEDAGEEDERFYYPDQDLTDYQAIFAACKEQYPAGCVNTDFDG
jgi:hypothetical protein